MRVKKFSLSYYQYQQVKVLSKYQTIPKINRNKQTEGQTKIKKKNFLSTVYNILPYALSEKLISGNYKPILFICIDIASNDIPFIILLLIDL